MLKFLPRNFKKIQNTIVYGSEQAQKLQKIHVLQVQTKDCFRDCPTEWTVTVLRDSLLERYKVINLEDQWYLNLLLTSAA